MKKSTVSLSMFTVGVKNALFTALLGASFVC